MNRKFIKALNFLPLITGSFLMLAICLPWYVLAEYKTPGFLEYFIIGEHFNRFLVPGWSGDQYGFAHKVPLGMIWVFAFVSIIPWSLVIIYWLFKNIKNLRSAFSDTKTDGWISYLFLWAVWSLLFFTIARNIIITYAIISLPAIALLIVEVWNNKKYQLNYSRWLSVSLLLPTVIISGVMIIGACNLNLTMLHSYKLLAQKYLELRSSKDSQFYFYSARKYSAEFYTGGFAKSTEDISILKKLLDNQTRDFIVVKHIDALPVEISEHFVKIGVFNGRVLLEEKEK